MTKQARGQTRYVLLKDFSIVLTLRNGTAKYLGVIFHNLITTLHLLIGNLPALLKAYTPDTLVALSVTATQLNWSHSNFK